MDALKSSGMRETSCQKMMKNRAEKDRIINVFPQPYDVQATPYKQMDFDPEVRNACFTNRTITVGLKICKAIFVGNVAVGKTSLVNRFCHEVFDREYKATIGVDFEVERFDILQTPFNLQIWDTAGQERFKCIASSYYRGAHVVVVVFDLTDHRSLEATSQWLDEALQENIFEPHLFLIGTKKDLLTDSAFQFMEKQAMRTARQLKAEFWAVSSKTGENVLNFYCRLAALSFNASVLKEIEQPRNTKLGSNLIRIQRNSNDLYEQKQKPKCLSCK